eukprot:267613_1
MDDLMKKRASKRLMRDWREWKNCAHEAKSITAAPLESNLFEWHCNFCTDTGPLKGIIFHLMIEFPDRYPLNPPTVTVCNKIHHPNVFCNYGGQGGYYICLDMLNTGWSAAYSVTSLLFQLLSFLITDKAPQDDGMDQEITYSTLEISDMMSTSKNYSCKKCTHSFKNPFPSLATMNNTKISGMKKEKKVKTTKFTVRTKRKQKNYWSKLMYPDLETAVIDFLTIIDLLSVVRVSKAFDKMVNNSKYLEMNKYSCWFHRIDLRYSALSRVRSKNQRVEEQDLIANNLILGYGITPQWLAGCTNFKSFFSEFQTKNDSIKIAKKRFSLVNVSRDPHLRFPILKKTETTFDLFSSDAFSNCNVRVTPRKDKRFTHFIPMYISGTHHGKRALDLEKSFTLSVYQANRRINVYHPMMSVHLICSIMSSLVINLMNALRDKRMHHSINVLETYFNYYHLLLAVYHKYYKIIYPLV